LGSILAAELSGSILKALFGVLLVLLATQLFFQKKKPEDSTGGVYSAVFPTLIVGFLVGLFSGFFGVGGGGLAIPLMVRFMGISIHRAVGISISFVFFAALVGTGGYIAHGWGKQNLPPYSLGYVYGWAWIFAGIPSILFAQWGAKLAHKTKPLRLRRAFSIFFLIVGLRMLWDSLGFILKG
jgi:uncharacterized membrane protein YfcA